jgi:hypothetical protein
VSRAGPDGKASEVSEAAEISRAGPDGKPSEVGVPLTMRTMRVQYEPQLNLHTSLNSKTLFCTSRRGDKCEVPTAKEDVSINLNGGVTCDHDF